MEQRLDEEKGRLGDEKLKQLDFTAHKKPGFSISTRATEPQVPEGTIVFALNLLNASAV